MVNPVARRVDYYHDPAAPRANSIVVAVTAFVEDDAGRLLMIRHSDNDLYAIPGGAQEIGEILTQTVVREVREETGITVEVTGLIGIYSDPLTSSPSPTARSAKNSPCASAPGPSPAPPRTSSESTEVHWVHPAKLDELTIHPSIRLRIQHGYEHRPQPYYT